MIWVPMAPPDGESRVSSRGRRERAPSDGRRERSLSDSRRERAPSVDGSRRERAFSADGGRRERALFADGRRERSPSEVSDGIPLVSVVVDSDAGRALLAHCWARKATVAVAALALAAAAAIAGTALVYGSRSGSSGGVAVAADHEATSTSVAAPALVNASAVGPEDVRNATAAASQASSATTTVAPTPAPTTTTTRHPVSGEPFNWPVNAIYVISLPDRPERLEKFMKVLEFTTGVPDHFVEVSPGVNAADARNHIWPFELLPNLYTDFKAGHAGNVGCCLAHMSAWKRVMESPGCQADGAEDEYALVLEDDEWVKGVLPAALRRLMRLVESSDGPKPDFINLNVIRPTGEPVPGGESLLSGSYVLQVEKGKGYAKCWDPADTTCPNIWLGAYLVRCGGAGKLIEGMRNLERDGEKFDGTLSFDRAMSDMLMGSPPASEAVAWMVGPNNSFTVHSEEQSARKDLNGGLAN